MPLSVAEIAEIREIFHQFDANNDGVIGKDELGALLSALNAEVSADRIDRALAGFDKNGNGVIEFQEFIDWFSDQVESDSDSGDDE